MRNALFQSVSIRKPKYNAFDLSHEKKLSMNPGQLVPVYVQETVPGDKFRVKTEMLLRMAPMIAPVMHRVNAFMHFFFVPNRLVYDDWAKFITGGEDGLQAPAFPKITLTEQARTLFAPGTLADFMGAPTIKSTDPAISTPLEMSALPFRAYQLIYNEYYRDQNLTSPIPITTDGSVTAQEQQELLALRFRAWEKDYFTSGLPWAQRGGEVIMPGEASYYDVSYIKDATSGGAVGLGDLKVGSHPEGGGSAIQSAASANTRVENIEGYDISINDFRRAARLQEWLEKNARAGSRYIEQILSHFGVRISDYKLQRPLYLGGGRNPVVISEVLSTFDNENTPGGQMYGHGISVGNTNQFKQFFEEHGFIIGILSVLPRTAYQQGIDRSLVKFDKFDYYFPEFAHIGEQEVKNKEVFYDTAISAENEGTFAYQSRYAEYKFNQSRVHGDFKDSLSFWHMGRIFDTKPALNSSFVTADPTHRCFAVTDPSIAKLYVQLYNDVQALRPMPVFGTPML